MKLEELANIRIGLPLARKKGDIHDDSFFRYQAVTLKAFSSTGRLLLDQLDEFIAKEEISSHFITSQGDILVRLREPNIAVHIDEKSSGVIVPALMAIIKPNQNINSIYLTHFINSHEVQKRLRREIKGTTIPMIKAQDLSKLEVTLPTMQTQEKIVSILNLANREIELLGQLQNLKTQLKNELLDSLLKKEAKR
ncbi:MAG: restriction endonuclease subunit S [Campylobacterota bacterium]|nr:restriction endonuclease subunit S [Campylobacterota bacterium]